MTTAAGWVEIDTGAIAHNLDLVRTHLGEGVALCAVLKADAYGHGVDLVAPVLVAGRVGRLGITGNVEARAVRDAGFTGRLLRLRPALADEILDGAAYDIEEWLGGREHAEAVTDAASRLGRPVRVHVSLNSTGLSRDGIPVDTGVGRATIASLAGRTGLDIVGVAAHFPREDAVDVERGAAVFGRESAVAIELLGNRRLDRHCATTYAALSVPASRFDMVRIGAALYGDSPLLDGALRPAMRVLSRVAALNDYAAGGTAGYDRAYTLQRDARLAVIPVGYADGYHRALGQRAEVLIGGRRAPVVDRLAMNTLLVDVSDLPRTRVGDEVVLYGTQGGDAITSADIERVSGQIAADLYTAWGRLLPRRAVEVTVRTASIG